MLICKLIHGQNLELFTDNPEIAIFRSNFSVTHCHIYFCSIQNQTWVKVCSLGIYSNILTIRFFMKVLWKTAVYSKQILATMMSYVIINLFWQQFMWQQLIFFLYLLISHYCKDVKKKKNTLRIITCKFVFRKELLILIETIFLKLIAFLPLSIAFCKKILF